MTALARMRTIGYATTGLAVAPLLAALVLLGVLYGGGAAPAGEAYGVSAVILVPVLAWQTKQLLDAEPDVQRRLARVAVGGREVPAGLLAAVFAALPVVALAMVVPWLVGGVTGPQRADDQPLVTGLVLGVWAHLLLIPPALAIGGWASRAVTRTAGAGAAVLASGVVGALVLGLDSSPVPWLAPPLLAVARQAARGGVDASLLVVSGWSLLWTIVVLAGYVLVRRHRT